jgi:ABC-type multidrug transport system ATPase subunit
MRDDHGDALALEADNLSAGYGNAGVFHDVGIKLAHGESLRVTGPNAAGKSTLLRCLAGIHQVSAGRIAICGADIRDEPVLARERLGYSDGAIPFTFLTGREHLKLGLRVYRLPDSALDAVLDRFSSWASVRDIDKEIRRYSHGMRQQLSALLSILHDPCLLLLDEAIAGFDDDTLTDWCRYLAKRAETGRALAYVEHRDAVAAAFPVAATLALTERQGQ